jgi:hypothetical protein
MRKYMEAVSANPLYEPTEGEEQGLNVGTVSVGDKMKRKGTSTHDIFATVDPDRQHV